MTTTTTFRRSPVRPASAPLAPEAQSYCSGASPFDSAARRPLEAHSADSFGDLEDDLDLLDSIRR